MCLEVRDRERERGGRGGKTELSWLLLRERRMDLARLSMRTLRNRLSRTCVTLRHRHRHCFAQEAPRRSRRMFCTGSTYRFAACIVRKYKNRPAIMRICNYMNLTLRRGLTLSLLSLSRNHISQYRRGRLILIVSEKALVEI